jgi:CheY-like chemotaxis protein
MKKTIRILHLEDDLREAEIVRATLSKEGFSFEIVRVTSENEFVSALQQGSYDLILAEYESACFDGLRALSVAQKKTPEVPFIFVSKPIGEERVAEALLNGAANYVLKGRLSRLGSAIRHLVHRDRAPVSGNTVAEREERLRALLDASHDSAFLIDANGHLLAANETFAKNVGESLYELKCRSVYGFPD